MYKLGGYIETPGESKYKITPAAMQVTKDDAYPAETKSEDTSLQDYALPFDSNVENYIATNQSKWGLLGKAAVQTISEATLGTIEGASYLLDWEQAVQKLQGDEQEYTNWLADAMKEAKAKVQDATKVYQTDDAQEGFAPGDATWWAKNAPSTIGTALSLMVPAMGAAGVASKFAKLANLGATATKTAGSVAATFASRYAESTMEANQVFEKTYAKLKEDPTMSDEIARQKAGEAASKTWNTNWVFSAMDFMQYNSLLKGFTTASKGVMGRSIGEIAKTIGSESLEEAGQFVTAEEAYSSATAETEFFGRGFSKRLSDYVQDPEFQASAFLGGVGGAVFAGAGIAAEEKDKESTESPTQPKISEVLKKQTDKVTKRGIQKENANYTSDTGTSKKLDDLTFTELAFQKIATGKLPQYKADLEQLEKDPKASPEAKANIRKYVEDAQFLQDEQAKLKNSNLPGEIHTAVLATKLEQRHLTRLNDDLTRELNDLKQEAIKAKELSSEAVAIKDLQISAAGYAKLAETNPQFVAKAAELTTALQMQASIAFPDQDVNTILHTSKDADMFKKAFQLASTDEKMQAIKKDLVSLTTPEGLKAYTQKAIDKGIEAKLPKASVPELMEMEKKASSPETKAKIAARFDEIKKAKQDENKKQVKTSVQQALEDTLEATNDGPPALDSEDLIARPPDYTENGPPMPDETFLEDSNLPETDPEVINGLTREESARMFGPEVAAQIFAKVEKEQDQEEKAIPDSKKTQDKIANTELKTANQASVYLKELAGTWNGNKFETKLDATGAAVIQEWYDNNSGKLVNPTEVFASDKHGNLLINTPMIQPGMKVTLKVENDFPFTITPGFKPTSQDNFVINAYVEGHSKPVFQLPSADNKHLEDNKKGNAKLVEQLRKKVIAAGKLETTISDKSFGDVRKSDVSNSLEVLQFDYYQDENNNWKLGKLEHNPILGIYVGGLKLPNVESMKGMSKNEFERLKTLDTSLFAKEPQPGQTVVLRTNSKGDLKVIPLDNRQLDANEKGWVKSNIVKLLSNGQIETLREVLNIPNKGVGVLKKGEIQKLKRDKFYFIDFKGKELDEVLMPYKYGWARLTIKQLDDLMNKRPVAGLNLLSKTGVPFKDTNPKDRYNVTPETTTVLYSAIDTILDHSFKNVKKTNINSELPYTDPVTGTTYNSYFEYATATNSLQTKLLGAKNQGVGNESGFSIHNATVSLDPNPSQIVVDEVAPNELVIKNVPEVSKPTDQKKTKGKRSLSDLYGKTREVSLGKKLVNFNQILDSNPLAADVIEKLSNNRIALTGSLALSVQGSIYRDAQYGVHDLDFITNQLSSTDASKLMSETYPNAIKVYDFDSNGYKTLTFIVPAPGTKVADIRKSSKGRILSYNLVEDTSSPLPSIVGTYQFNDSKESFTGERGILVDIFIDPKERDLVSYQYNYSGKTRPLLISSHNDIFKTKLDIGRAKDKEDYSTYDLTEFGKHAFKVITPRELQWFKDTIGEEFLSIAKGVDRIIANGGIEAFGVYHNALVTIADYAETGTAYHEAFHFVFDNLLSPRQQQGVLKYGTEEQLAEDFRAYMLSGGKVKPKKLEVKNFFARLWQAIQNLLGLRSPIERLFKEIATTRLTAEQKANIAASIKDQDPSFRLLPGQVNSKQQNEIIAATTQEVVNIAREWAVKANLEFEDLFTQQGVIDKLFAEVKNKFLKDYDRIVAIPEDDRVDEDEYRRQIYISMGIIDPSKVEEDEKELIGQWEDIGTDLQVETGFKTEVLKNFAKWGFTVKLKDGTEYSVPEDGEDSSTDEIQELKAQDEGERIYDLDHTLVSPAKSLTQRIKSFLSTIPEPVISDKGEIVYNEDGTQRVKTTVLGSPQIIDFRKAFRNLTGKIADHGTPLTRLEELSKLDPISKAIYDALSKEVASGNQRLLAEFNTKLNLVRHPYVTFLYGRDKQGTPIAKVIAADRADLQRTIVNKWREGAVKRNFIKSDGTVVTTKAEHLLKKLLEAKSLITSTTPYADVEKQFKGVLKEIGIELAPQTWIEMSNKRGAPKTIRDMLFLEKSSSLLDFLQEAVKGEKDPFENLSKLSVLNRLAAVEKSYIDDVRADVFLNEAGNQVNSINTPSYIAEFINDLHNNGAEKAAFYLQDKFYQGNAFIDLWKHDKTASRVNFYLPSAMRKDEGKAKEFGDRTTTDSYLMRLIGFHNGGANEGFVSVGTLSDKSKQVFLTLPKHVGKNAESFLRKVMRNTVDNEISRIKRIKAGLPVDLSTYQDRGQKFVYLPELNNIQGITDSVSDGEVKPADLDRINKEIDQVITKFIDTNYAQFVSDLINEGVIKRNKEGKLENVEISPAILQGKEINTLLQEFFYNDIAWRTEMSKVFHGDMALYKDDDAYYKRGYQIVTPGLKAWDNPEKPLKLIRAIFQRIIKTNSDEYLLSLAQLIDPSVKSLKETGKSAVKQALKYKKVNKTDAQSLCTVHAWKNIMERFGAWTKDHQRVYDFAWGKNLTISEAIKANGYNPEQAKEMRGLAAKVVLQPFKPFQISDRVLDTPTGKMILKEQFKDSISPLIPDFAKKHNNQEGGYGSLLTYMTQHNIDIISSDDAVKVGAYGVITDFSVPPTSIQSREVSINDIRFPQIIPDKVKTEVTMLTQFWKLLPGNIDPKTKYSVGNKELTGEQVMEQLNELWAERTATSSKELQNKLGLDSTWKLSEDKAKRKDQLFKLKTLLQSELMSRDLNDNYHDSLQLILRNIDRPEFTLQLGFPMLGRKFLSVLTNLFKKNILKQKEPGYSMINLADFGISNKEQNSNLSFIRNNKGEIEEAEIGMPIEFFSQIKLNWIEDVDPITNKIKWEKLNQQQKEALQMIMVRIPTSNKSSMMPVRVAMILPKAMGSVVMVPGEGTTQMGFDFDVDKSSLIKRVLDKEGKIDKESIDTKLFDLAWSILTNKAHAEELLTPLAAPTLEEKVEEYSKLPDPLGSGNIVNTTNKGYVLSTVTDVRMERQNKQAKSGIGIASRFNTGHAMMQALKDFITVPGIRINTSNYKFNKVGGVLDNEGNLISNNHAQLQHAELDGAKDPLLAKLNVPPVLLPLAGYMVDVGMSLSLTMDFLNQPIIREWLRMYGISGGTNIYTATAKLLEEYPQIKAAVDDFRTGEEKKGKYITIPEIKEGLTIPISQNVVNQAKIFDDFTNYLNHAQLVSDLNTVLSIDTFQDMTGIEAIESFSAKVAKVTNQDSPVSISKRVFDLATAPPQAKRLAAFYKYSLNDAISLTSQFYPYFSNSYRDIKNTYANAAGIANLTDKDTLIKLNQFTDFYVLEGKNLLRPTLDKVSPNYTSRWSFFDNEKTIWRHLQSVVEKYPGLKDNALIKGIESIPTNRRDGIPMIGVVNTNSNLDKTQMIQGWWDMMTSPNEAVRILAGDLIRFAIYTSGFGYNTKSFIDLVPVQFWVQNGIAENHRVVLEGMYTTDESGQSATQLNSLGVVRSFIRHNFADLDIPEVFYYESKDGDTKTNLKNVKKTFTTGQQLDSFVVSDDDRTFNGRNSTETMPQFVKLWDYDSRRYRLYEASPSKPSRQETLYKEVQPLGEAGNFFEVSPNGDNKSYLDRNKDSGKPTPFGTGKSIDMPLNGGSVGTNKYVATYIPGHKTTPEVALQRIVERETNVRSKQLASVLLNNADKINSDLFAEALEPRIVDGKSYGRVGTYRMFESGNTKIIINNEANIKSDSAQRYVILHELTHAFISGVIAHPQTEREINFKRNMERLWEKAKKLDPKNKQIYNLQEFVAELASNAAFRDRLKSGGLWSTLLRLVRKVLGLPSEFDQALDEMYSIINETEQLQRISASDFDLLMENEKKTPSQRKRLDIIERVMSSLKAREERLRVFGQKEQADLLKKDIDVLKQLSGVKRNQFIVKFLAIVGKEVDALNKTVERLSAVDPANVNTGVLLAAKEQLDSYSVLDQIRLELRKNPEAFAPVKEAVPALLKQFEELFNTIKDRKEDIRNITINRVATVIKQKSNNPDLKIAEIKDRLEVADRDISWTNRLFDPLADSSDEALATLDKLIKHAFSEGSRLTNQDLYTKEPKEVTVEYKHYNEKNKKIGKDGFKYKAVGLFKALQDFEAWTGKKDTIADKFKAIIDTETLQNNSNGVSFISPISPRGKEILAIKEGSKDYPLRQFYENFVLGYLKSQEAIHLPSMRPGLRIPTIQRSLMEGILAEKGLGKLDVLKQEAIDTIRRRYDETDFRAVDENGKPQDYIPIRFISRQDGKDGRLSTREVSLDIATTVGIFMNEMHTYKQLEKIVADAELIKSALEQRELVKEGNRVEGHGLTGFLTRERKAITDPESGLMQTIKGSESNAYKAAETGIRRLIYGQFKKDAGQAKVFGQNIDIRKSVDSFMKFTGLRILFGNLAIPLTNLGMGHLTMAKEAIGGNLISMSNWKAGQAFYGKVLKDAILDLGNREKKTKFGRVYTYFNPADNQRPVDHIGIDTTKMRTVLPHLTRGLSESTEFNLSSVALGAVFDRFKAANSEGKEVSLYDAIEVSMDGKISLSKGYKYKSKSTLEGKDIDEVRDYALRLYQNMNGVYNKLDSSAIKETVAGSLIMFMRNWLAPGIATRYRLRHFDERLQQENEGHYISALVLFNNYFHPDNGFVKGTLDSLKTMLWMEATDPESLLLPNELGLPEEKKQQIINMRKANVRKTIFELYVIAGLSVLMFAGFDDDDQDSYALYMLARMRREMMTFISPSTAWDVLRSPSVAINTIDAMNKALYSTVNAAGALLTGEELKVMEQGKGKGLTEVWYRTRALTPLGQLDQFDELDTSVRLITKGWR